MQVFKRVLIGGASVVVIGMTSMTQAHEWQIDEDTTLSAYGSLELLYLNERVEAKSGEVEDRQRLVDRDTTLGVSGSHQFSDVLTGFFKAEFEYAGGVLAGDGDEDAGEVGEIDEAYVGLKGPWGRAQLGDWDGIYEDLVADTTDVFEYDGLTNFEDYRTAEVADAFAYMSPSLGGFSFAVQGFYKGRRDNDQDTAVQAVVGYAFADYTIHVGYDDNGLRQNADGTIGISAAADWQPISLAVKYEHVGEDRGDPNNPNDTRGVISAYTLTGAYDYGPGSVILAVQRNEPEFSEGRTEFGVNVNYSITDNFYVYTEHMGYDQQHNLANYTGVGLVYEF